MAHRVGRRLERDTFDAGMGDRKGYALGGLLGKAWLQERALS